jgi:fructan beta-fructosidase
MLTPKFHHIAPGQWINDPVGLHRHDGHWVLHDQRAGSAGEPAIGWGRATSPDLLHWTDEGLAIPPEADAWIYSGSVVADAAPPLAFFTLHRPATGLQAQAAAEWRSGWRRLPGERVPAAPDSRDPFVFRWGDEWRMLIGKPAPWAAPYRHPSRLMLLASPDLMAWRELGPLAVEGMPGELFETPLLRRIPVAGAPPADWPWLLAVGVVDRRGDQAICGTRAWFGPFDGDAFTPVGEAFPLDRGPDFYAPAMWAGTDEDEIVVTGWSNSWDYARRLPSVGWSGGAHALPRRWSARREANGWSLQQWPAKLPAWRQRRALRAGAHRVPAQCLLRLEGRGAVTLGDVSLRKDADSVVLERTCGLPALAGRQFSGFWRAPCPDGPLAWLIDGCVTELFALDGSLWMSALSLRREIDPVAISDGLAVSLEAPA